MRERYEILTSIFLHSELQNNTCSTEKFSITECKQFYLFFPRKIGSDVVLKLENVSVIFFVWDGQLLYFSRQKFAKFVQFSKRECFNSVPKSFSSFSKIYKCKNAWLLLSQKHLYKNTFFATKTKHKKRKQRKHKKRLWTQKQIKWIEKSCEVR